MLVRIKGKVEDILQQVGTSRDGRHWAKKTYVIRDTTFKEEDKNRKVHVDEFGTLDPDAKTAEFCNFTFDSSHDIGEVVDLACSIKTNDNGFTNVTYYRPFEETEAPRENKSNVIKPEDAAPVDLEPVPMQAEGVSTVLF